MMMPPRAPTVEMRIDPVQERQAYQSPMETNTAESWAMAPPLPDHKMTGRVATAGQVHKEPWRPTISVEGRQPRNIDASQQAPDVGWVQGGSTLMWEDHTQDHEVASEVSETPSETGTTHGQPAAQPNAANSARYFKKGKMSEWDQPRTARSKYTRSGPRTREDVHKVMAGAPLVDWLEGVPEAMGKTVEFANGHRNYLRIHTWAAHHGTSHDIHAMHEAGVTQWL